MARQLIDLETQTNWTDYPASGVPTRQNKKMAALATSSDGDLACNTSVATTPAADSYVTVRVNGQSQHVGDGTEVGCDCYFSADGGTTARAIADVAAGDLLYWNGSVAGFELEATWVIDFDYDVPVAGTGGGGSLGLATEGQIELWVRAVDGDDGNSGTATDEPLATLQAAVNKIPHIVNHTIIIHVGPHAGNGYVPPCIENKVLNASIYIIGDGAGSGDGFIELLGSTAALAGSDQYTIKSSGLSASENNGFGEYHGKTIEILTGDAAGDRRTISINTDTDIIPQINFSSSITASDTYRIVEPAIVLRGIEGPSMIQYDQCLANNIGGTVAQINNQLNDNDSCALWLINFQAQKDVYSKYLVHRSSVIFLGVDTGYGAWCFAQYSSVFAGWESLYTGPGGTWGSRDGVPTPVSVFGLQSNTSWLGWGVSGSWCDIRGNDSNCLGCFCVGELDIYGENVRAQVYVSLHDTHAARVSSNSELTIRGGYPPSWLVKSRIGGNAGSDEIVRSYEKSLMFLSGTVEINVNNGIGIQSRDDSMIIVTSYTNIYITNGIGLKVDRGGTIKLTSLPTIVGGSADIEIGGNYYSLSELSDSGDAIVDPVHGKIFRE